MTWLLSCHWTPEIREESFSNIHCTPHPSVMSERVVMAHWCLSQVNDHTPSQVLAPPSILPLPNCLRFSRKPKSCCKQKAKYEIFSWCGLFLMIDHDKLHYWSPEWKLNIRKLSKYGTFNIIFVLLTVVSGVRGGFSNEGKFSHC